MVDLQSPPDDHVAGVCPPEGSSRQRACEAAIDLAMHVVRTRRLGIPQESRDAFVLLRDAGVIEPGLVSRMLGMVGFRNIAVHDYRQLDLVIVRAIITERLDDFLDLTRALLSE